MLLWPPYLLLLRVWASNALEIGPRGTFRFAQITNGSLKLERMTGSRFLEDCLQLCIELKPFCNVAGFFEVQARCSLGYRTQFYVFARGLLDKNKLTNTTMVL